MSLIKYAIKFWKFYVILAQDNPKQGIEHQMQCKSMVAKWTGRRNKLWLSDFWFRHWLIHCWRLQWFDQWSNQKFFLHQTINNSNIISIIMLAADNSFTKSYKAHIPNIHTLNSDTHTLRIQYEYTQNNIWVSLLRA